MIEHKLAHIQFVVLCIMFLHGLSWWLSGKELACNATATGDMGPVSGLGRSLGGGHGIPLQYSCLENSMERRAWQATVHGVTRVGHDLMTKAPP